MCLISQWGQIKRPLCSKHLRTNDRKKRYIQLLIIYIHVLININTQISNLLTLTEEGLKKRR